MDFKECAAKILVLIQNKVLSRAQIVEINEQMFGPEYKTVMKMTETERLDFYHRLIQLGDQNG